MPKLFEDLNFDSVTVCSVHGKDSVEPFLAFENKHTIMLALTSNEGAFDFQTLSVDKSTKHVYNQKLEEFRESDVGATKAEYFNRTKVVPDSFLLVPEWEHRESSSEVCKYGMNANVLLINSSRGIIYASSGTDFAEKQEQKR
jgi:orotidine-5'-phosphate decarboxylase